MAKFKYKLSKSEFEKLEASEKENYVASGDDYVLDAEGVEDVSGLKNKIAELLKDTKNKGDLLKTFEGLDPEAAKKLFPKWKKSKKRNLPRKANTKNF